MSFQAPVNRMLTRYGAKFTLRRSVQGAGAQPWKTAAAVTNYYPMRARERGYKPEELVGSVVEGDAVLIVDAASLSQRPAPGDRVASGTHVADGAAEWRQVVSVDEATEQSSVRVYRLQVRA